MNLKPPRIRNQVSAPDVSNQMGTEEAQEEKEDGEKHPEGKRGAPGGTVDEASDAEWRGEEEVDGSTPLGDDMVAPMQWGSRGDFKSDLKQLGSPKTSLRGRFGK